MTGINNRSSWYLWTIRITGGATVGMMLTSGDYVVAILAFGLALVVLSCARLSKPQPAAPTQPAPTPIICPACRGMGRNKDNTKCELCRGKGTITTVSMGHNSEDGRFHCHLCDYVSDSFNSFEMIEAHAVDHLKTHGRRLKYAIEDATGKVKETP